MDTNNLKDKLREIIAKHYKRFFEIQIEIAKESMIKNDIPPIGKIDFIVKVYPKLNDHTDTKELRSYLSKLDLEELEKLYVGACNEVSKNTIKDIKARSKKGVEQDLLFYQILGDENNDFNKWMRNTDFSYSPDIEVFSSNVADRIKELKEEIKDYRKDGSPKNIREYVRFKNESEIEFLKWILEDMTTDSKDSIEVITTIKESNHSTKLKRSLTYTFDSIFTQPEYKLQALEAAKTLGIISFDESGKIEWTYNKKRVGAIMPLIKVLRERKKIHFIDEYETAKLFADKFRITISDRTIRHRPKYFTELAKELKTLIE